MKTYFAMKNHKRHHKQDPDYFVFLPKADEHIESKLVGKIYKNRGKNGTQYLKIIIFNYEQDNPGEGH